MALISWTFEVDWDGDGSYSGTTNEDDYLRDLKIRRGRDNMIKGDGKGFEPVRIGEFTAVLDNQNGRYDPGNTGSPLYPNVKPGRRVKINATVSGVTYNLFDGQIVDIQSGGGSFDRIVKVSGKDALSWLDNQIIDDALYTYYPVAQAIVTANSRAGWTRTSTVDSSPDQIRYFGIGEVNAKDIVDELVSTFMGVSFISGAGAFKYYARSHAYTDKITLTQADLLKNVEYPQPWENIFNIVTAYAYNYRTAGVKTIFSLDDPIIIPARSTVKFWGDWKYNGQSCEAEWYAYNIVFNSQSDGLGADLSGYINPPSVFSVYAKKFYTELYNSSYDDGYLLNFDQTGYPLSFENPIQYQVSDATSKAAYMPHEFLIDSHFIQDYWTAKSFADIILSKLKAPQSFPTIYLQGNETKQFTCDLFDQIDLTISALGISGKYLVGSIEHSWTHSSGQAVLTKLKLEPKLFDPTNYWKFSTNIGTTSYFGI